MFVPEKEVRYGRDPIHSILLAFIGNGTTWVLGMREIEDGGDNAHPVAQSEEKRDYHFRQGTTSKLK